MKKLDIYKGENSLVEVLSVKDENEVILNFEKLEEKSEDASTEKHVPYLEEKENGYLVKVGKEAKHPMTPEHWIEFIEIVVDDYLYRKYLKPGDEPEAFFNVPKGKVIKVREYCNIHGLWKS